MALLERMANRYPREELGVVHFNHCQRGIDSDADCGFVGQRARALGLPFWSERGTVKKKSEATLRDERWSFFRKIQKETKAHWVVTAHTLEDQLETFLMRLLRGVGVDGLVAMKKKENGIYRPFLSRSRASLPDVSFREDVTNSSEVYFRNRVRKRLLPLLYELSEPYGGEKAFLKRFCSLQKDLRWNSKQMQSQEGSLFKRIVFETPYWLRVSKEEWAALSPQWQRRLLRSIAKKLGILDLSREEIQRVRKGLEKRRGDLGRGRVFEVSYGQVYFHKRSIDPKIRVQGDRVTCEEIGFEAIVGPEMQGEWRFFQPGDRLGEKKLKERWITQRIPAPERRIFPLLTEVSSSCVKWAYPQVNPSIQILRSDFIFSF